MDSLRRASRLNKGEDLAIIEEERQAIEHELYEGLHIMDEWRNDMRTLAREQVKAMEHIAKHATSAQFDGFHVQDDYKKIWQAVQNFREELKTLDKAHRNIYAVRDDRIAIADKRLVKLQRTLHEAVETDESFNRDMVFIRGFEDLARIGDGLTRDIGKNSAEDIALYDAFVRASNSYVESVQVLSSFKEVDDFTAMSDTPPLYEQFTDFNVGDYEYEKALLRLRVVSKATQAQPLLYDVSPHVDIDDTDDKGQLEIKDATAATKVYYNKHYYNAPEVNAMVKGGTGTTTPVPNILTTDGQDDKGRYFEIELLNSSGNRQRASSRGLRKDGNMQEYNELVTTDACNTYLEKADKNIQSVASTFSGTAFPTTNLAVGMQCMRTDDSNNIYKLTSTSPVTWELVPSKSYVDNAVTTGVKSITNFKGATSTAAGAAGLVPAPAEGTQTDYYLSADGTWKKVQQRSVKEVIDIVHPVGSIWETTTTDDPNTLWSGTTWVKMDAGRVLVAAGSYTESGTTYTYNLGDTGGEAEHQLSTDELAYHIMGPAAPRLAIIRTHTPSQLMMAMANRPAGQVTLVVVGTRLLMAAITYN